MKNYSLTANLTLLKTLNLAGIMLILGLLVISNVQVATAESNADPKAPVEQSLEVWNKGNIALIDELYTPEFKLHFVDQVKPELVGTEALKQYVNFLRTAYPDMKYEPNQAIIDGDKVITLMNFTGTNTGPRGDIPPTGRKVEVSLIRISRVDGGKIAEEWVYMNMASVFRQLGFTITPPSQE